MDESKVPWRLIGWGCIVLAFFTGALGPAAFVPAFLVSFYGLRRLERTGQTRGRKPLLWGNVVSFFAGGMFVFLVGLGLLARPEITVDNELGLARCVMKAASFTISELEVEPRRYSETLGGPTKVRLRDWSSLESSGLTIRADASFSTPEGRELHDGDAALEGPMRVDVRFSLLRQPDWLFRPRTLGTATVMLEPVPGYRPAPQAV